MSWEDAQNMAKGHLGLDTPSGGDGNDNKNPADFQTRMVNGGYVKTGDTTKGYLEGWGITVPDDAIVYGKNGEVQYITDKSGAYYSS
jgi:hypothetical protein